MHSPSEGRDLPRDEIRRAFEQRAPDLDLVLEEPTRSSRDVGLIFIASRRLTEVARGGEGPGPGPDDDAITELVRRWESLKPDDRRKGWRGYATDPVVGVGWRMVGVFDQESFDRWAEDETLREQQSPYGSGGEVEIEDLRIVYAGEGTAVATYRIEWQERGAANMGVMLLRGADGWRIAAQLIPGSPPDEEG